MHIRRLILASALASSPLLAQTATVEHFGDESRDRLELRKEFDALGGSSSPIAQAAPVQDFTVPREAATVGLEFGSPCSPAEYYLFPGIGIEAQRRRAAYFDLIVRVACEEGVPLALFDALIAQESRYNPRARSPAGAMGLTQLMPATARGLGVRNAFDAEENLRGGARYLRQQIERFSSWRLALGAYNAGPGRIEQYGDVPPFRETRNYVRVVLSSARAITDGASDARSEYRSRIRRVQLSSYSGD